MRSMLAALALATITAGPGSAQTSWGIAMEIGIERFWGASGPLVGSDQLALRPYRPTRFGIRIDRRQGGISLALSLAYADSPIGAEYEGGATVFAEGFTLIELAPEVASRLARLGAGGLLGVFAGPVLRFWIPPEESIRTRAGARGGIQLEAALGSRVSLVTRAHAGIAPSAFEEADVPTGYEVRAMPSAGVALGIRVGL